MADHHLHYGEVKSHNLCAHFTYPFTPLLCVPPCPGGQGDQHRAGAAGRGVGAPQREVVPGAAPAERFRQEQPDPALSDLLSRRAEPVCVQGKTYTLHTLRHSVMQ